MKTVREKRNPNALITVTSALLKEHPEYKPFWQPRHDIEPDDSFVQDIERNGLIHSPVITKFNGSEVVVAGNRRTKGARRAGLDEIDVDVMPLDWDVIESIQVAENEQRQENSIFDKIHNILKYLKIDPESGKPAGMSYEEVGKRFNYTHQTIRDFALMGLKAPKWLTNGVQNAQISFTDASRILKNNLKNEGGDEAKLKEAFEKVKAESGTSRAGNPRRARDTHAGSGKPQAKLLQHWAYSGATPALIRSVLQVVLGEVSIVDAKKHAKGELEWMVETVPKKEKVKKEKAPKAETEAEPTVPQEAAFDMQFGG